MPIGLIATAIGLAIGVATAVISVPVAVFMAVVSIASYIFAPETPELAASPTYQSDHIKNTISEGYFVSRCYGRCKLGGNKLRFSAADSEDIVGVVGHCLGPVKGAVSYQVNDIDWTDLNCHGPCQKLEYTGTRTQTEFTGWQLSSKASAYRNIAYTIFHLGNRANEHVSYDPNITVVMDGLLCAPLAGGADAFTRNPAVILYDWYLNVEGYSAGDLDLNAFKSLEEFWN